MQRLLAESETEGNSMTMDEICDKVLERDLDTLKDLGMVRSHNKPQVQSLSSINLGNN